MGRRLETVDSLLDDLKSADGLVRNRAARRLREFAQMTVEITFKQASKRANRNNRGTLIWMLQLFDCSQHFNDLVELAVYGGFEAYCMASMVLNAQCFEVTQREISSARKMVRSMRAREAVPAEDLPLMKRELLATLDNVARRRKSPRKA